jgi:hypothetical protein
MRSHGSLSDTREREFDGVGAVDSIINSNAYSELEFLRSKYLGTLEVGTISAIFVPARHIEEMFL